MELSKYRTLVTESFNKFSPNSKNIVVSALTPDASSRLYFRIESYDSDNQLKRCIAMLFLSTKSPEAGGTISITSDQAVIELGNYFYQNGVAVPQIYYQDLTNSIIFIEDLGDLSLADSYSADANIDNYKSAIDQILIIQNIKKDKNFFPFKREFGFKQYRIELDEILDYSIIDISENNKTLLNAEFDKLSHALDSLEKVLVHRDYHSWNIMIDYHNKIRVIDYQDALMATKYYDLVALIHDRDTDQLLGEDAYLELLNYYYNKVGKPFNFLREFCLISLQRDLKVVGRFAKLDKIKVNTNYSKWIPGTVKRIARTLDYLGQEYGSLTNVLSFHYYEYFSEPAMISLNKLKL